MLDKKYTRVLISCAAFTALAAITGLIESLLPLDAVITLPGVKLGLANVFITLAIYTLGAKEAIAVMAARILIVFLFGGNPVSLALSVGGALFSFIGLFFMMKTYKKVFSFVGVSAVCSALHGVGQIYFAYFFIGSSVLYYLPVICIASTFTGAICGAVMNTIVRNTRKFVVKSGGVV